MKTLVLNSPINAVVNRTGNRHKHAKIESPGANFQFRLHQKIGIAKSPKICRKAAYSNSQSDNGGEDSSLQELRVPSHWLEPSKASEESEWLSATLHKWLDDEYCPEPTNIEISKIAAKSFYESLVEKTSDLGDILLRMALELESISYQESFHGAFSSANAAVNLVVQRILEE